LRPHEANMKLCGALKYWERFYKRPHGNDLTSATFFCRLLDAFSE
jgi:hypothetical protein